jgi:precorrin-2 dehydrogenase/sirohydrochlorin ferrochelatase
MTKARKLTRVRPAEDAAELFPMFLKIAGRSCLVVGAGTVAESKIESLVRCDAKVCVVAPEATESVRNAAAAGEIVWHRRRYRKSDLDGALLVIAATSSPTLHERIFRQAQRGGILCNSVDEPSRCDFYYPAVVRRGPLQIAISTGGRSPALAQRLRRELAAQLAEEYGPWTEEIGRARNAVLARKLTPEQRKAIMHKLSSAIAFEAFRKSFQPQGRGKARDVR